MLGVTVQSDLKMTSHVSNKIEACSRTLFALKTLKAHGMPQTELREVFWATALTSLLYAAAGWWGFTLAEDRERLSALLRNAQKLFFYPPGGLSISDIVERDEKKLSKAIASNPAHSLYHFLPECKQTTHNLRPRAQPFTIPPSLSALHDKNYIVRMIRPNIY